MTLVLSLFPGMGMLDHAFELEGFTVVRGPDPLWGGDVRSFHPPASRFDGIIGGDPCQSHSTLANLVRAKGLTPRFPDLTGEFQRVVEEAAPAWFLRENVPRAPDIEPSGYKVISFLLCNSWLGEAQMRKRRFWFGWRARDDEPAPPNLRKWIPGVALELPEAGTAYGEPVNNDPARKRRTKEAPVTGRNEGAVGSPEKDYSPPRRSLAEMLELQGLPGDWLEHQPWTMQAKRRMVGNGVPIPMGRALAQAVRKATEE